MWLKEVADDIECNAYEDESREDRVRRASSQLCDYVYELLLEYGIGYGTVIDIKVYGAIQDLIAHAMITQCEQSAEMWQGAVAAFANDERIGPLPSWVSENAKTL